MPNGANAYLVEWTHKALAKEMEGTLPGGASTANRRRTSIRKVHSEMSVALGRGITAEEAAQETNRRARIARGIRPATRDGLLARTSDLPDRRVDAAAVRAGFADAILHSGSGNRLTSKRREDLVVSYNKAVIAEYGLSAALAGEMLARVTDVLPESAESEAARRAESDRLSRDVGRLAASNPGAPWAELVVAHNENAIVTSGHTALVNSGALVTAGDMYEDFFPPVDLDSIAGDRAQSVVTSSSPMIAPGESTLMVTALIAAAGERYPGQTILVSEMIDSALAGEVLRPGRELATLCGITRMQLAAAIEEIRETMRELLTGYLDTGNSDQGSARHAVPAGARTRARDRQAPARRALPGASPDTGSEIRGRGPL